MQRKRPLVPTATPGIFRRGESYVVRYRHDGKQVQESARTLDAARQIKRQRESARDRGESARPTRITLEQYAAAWIETYQGRKGRAIRDSTRAEYRRDLDRYILPALGSKQLQAVNKPAIVAFVKDLEAGALADRTIKRIIAPLSALLGDAAEAGIIAHNPVTGITYTKRDELRRFDADDDSDAEDPAPGKAKALTRAELDMVLAVAPEAHQLLFALLAATGLRISEALALRWRDLRLDGDSAAVLVRRAYVKGVFGPPKSKHGRRDVPLNFDLVRALRERRRNAEWCDDGDIVFCSTAGTPLHDSNLRRRVLNPTMQEAGVPWAGWHALRHTCASMLLSGGRNIVQVSRWLGHHSPAFTLTVYAHLMDEGVGGALDLADAPEPVRAEALVPDRLPIA